MYRLTPKLLLALVGVILVVAWVYNNNPMEGFEGEVPSAQNTSAIPKDVPGSTSSNPTVSKPQAKDIQSLQALMDNYYLLRQKIDIHATNLSEDQKTKILFMESMRAMMDIELKEALENPDAARFTQEEVLEVSKTYNDMVHALRGLTVVKTNVDHTENTPTTVANAPGIITLAELQSLKTRIEAEVLRLANLRSTSATFQARMDQLGKLSADIGDMISAVQRGTLKLEDVPIKPENAAAFLKAMSSSSLPLPPLQSVPGTTANSSSANPAMSEIKGLPNVLSNGQPNIQSLLEHAQYLKWNVNLKIEYDPKLAAQDRLLKRIEEMERRLTALAISETPIPPEMYKLYLQELQTLQAAFVPKHGALIHSGAPLDTLHTTYSRNGVDHNNPYVRNNAVELSQTDYPSAAQISAAQGFRQGPDGKFPNGEISPDVYVRPGFVMTDDTIARRASSSAFDPAAVGGLDYKNRVQEICRQIRSGQLGEPDNFGCIANPDTVSSSYSWKGNYEMVCNRLGDTWGGWYPEMFGCPKYDPAAKFKGTML